MQHWQMYYQQNKHLPLNKIMEGYNRLLNEFNERMMLITQQSPPSGAGPGGSVVPVILPLSYVPTEQTVEWYASTGWGNDQGDVSFQDFQLVPFSNVYGIYIYNTGLTPITSISNLSSYKNLWGLEIDEQNLDSLVLTGCGSIEYFYYTYNNGSLSSLDLSPVTNLTNAYVTNNVNLTSLNASNCTSLDHLECQTNNLTTLDVNNCTSLTYLKCITNNLTTLDVSSCTILDELYCYNNNLTAIDISNNTSLTKLQCETNNITTLDLSSNILLNYLTAQHNQLTQTAVDQILIDLDNNGVLGGYVSLAGTGNSPPSIASASAINSLITNGWFVITN